VAGSGYAGGIETMPETALLDMIAFDPLEVRNFRRRPFPAPGSSGEPEVKEFFIDHKIPAFRAEHPYSCSAEDIA